MFPPDASDDIISGLTSKSATVNSLFASSPPKHSELFASDGSGGLFSPEPLDNTVATRKKKNTSLFSPDSSNNSVSSEKLTAEKPTLNVTPELQKNVIADKKNLSTEISTETTLPISQKESLKNEPLPVSQSVDNDTLFTSKEDDVFAASNEFKPVSPPPSKKTEDIFEEKSTLFKKEIDKSDNQFDSAQTSISKNDVPNISKKDPLVSLFSSEPPPLDDIVSQVNFSSDNSGNGNDLFSSINRDVILKSDNTSSDNTDFESDVFESVKSNVNRKLSDGREDLFSDSFNENTDNSSKKGLFDWGPPELDQPPLLKEDNPRYVQI